MALAETAKLVASLELQDKFSKPAAAAGRAMDGLERKSNTLGAIGSKARAGLSEAGHNIQVLGVAAAGAIASQVALGVQSLTQLAEVTNQTQAVIKSTRGAAGVTAEDVRKLSENLEDLSTVDDKTIQAGENMLLTFKNIRNEVGAGNDIFNQASKTLLDLSTAMGTEPKQAAIQLGKALNDPIKGITALTRVGVTFTEKQKEQITTLVEAGKTMEAQKIILRELNSEFGGSAEAFGKGPGAAMRRFGDALEGAQQALATGFLPLIERVSAKVQEVLGDPKVLKGIEGFGVQAADAFDDLLNTAGKLPWGAIGDAAKLMGTGARALLDAFSSLPSWVQTAVLTGWGLNKLTGGALGGIVGELGKGLIKGVLGMNAGVVNINAATVNGGAPIGGAPAAGGRLGGGLVGGVAKFVLGPAAAVVIGAEIAKAINEKTIRPAIDFEDTQFRATLDHADAAQLQAGIDSINTTLDTSKTLGDPGYDALHNAAVNLSHVPIIGDALGNLGPELERQREDLQKKLDAVQAEEAKTGQIYAHGASEHNRVIRQEWRQAAQKIDGGILSLAQSERADAQRQLSETKRITPSLARVENVDRGVLEQTRATANRTSQAIERIRAVEAASRGTTATLERKNFSPNVDLTVGVTNQISISTISGAIQRDTYSTATGRVGGVIV